MANHSILVSVFLLSVSCFHPKEVRCFVQEAFTFTSRQDYSKYHTHSSFVPSPKVHGASITSILLFQSSSQRDGNAITEDGNEGEMKTTEVININEEDELENGELEWISDRDIIRLAASTPGGESFTNRNKDTLQKFRSAEIYPISEHAQSDNLVEVDEPKKIDIVERSNIIEDEVSNYKKLDNVDMVEKKSVYTEEEDELINAMGGKEKVATAPNSSSSLSREPGYLGDSTLSEIARDFSIPICYIADVLVTWGCPIPIDPNSILGDLVTGEQAFALLEAIHTLDISALHDRYSDDDIITVAEDYEIFLKDAFDYAVKEGWSLPFGVRTHLRVEQEEEMIRALADDLVVGE